jgi:hypothetical protein
MANETVAYIADMVDGAGDLDVSNVYDQAWPISQAIFDKINKRFPNLVRDPGTDELQNYGVDPRTGPGGTLSGYSDSQEVDWMVHSYIGEFKKAFVNVHITCWLGPNIDVPHLGMAWGTSPRPWFYFDHMMRRDGATNPDYFDKYCGYRNERFLALKTNPNLTTFTSRDPYIREVLSPTAMCFSVDDTPENWELMTEEAHRMVDEWLDWIDEAQANPVPAEERAQLQKNDTILRETITERDPANQLAVRRYPDGVEEKLVRALGAKDRTLPRPPLDFGL